MSNTKWEDTATNDDNDLVGGWREVFQTSSVSSTACDYCLEYMLENSCVHIPVQRFLEGLISLIKAFSVII